MARRFFQMCSSLIYIFLCRTKEKAGESKYNSILLIPFYFLVLRCDSVALIMNFLLRALRLLKRYFGMERVVHII